MLIKLENEWQFKVLNALIMHCNVPASESIGVCSILWIMETVTADIPKAILCLYIHLTARRSPRDLL